MGEGSDSVDSVKYWLDIAAYDLATAAAMLETKRFLYVGFMCHQTIEKTLKACYVSHRGTVPPFTHNLVLLARDSGVVDRLPKEHSDLLYEISPLNVEARYPDYKQHLMRSLTATRCRRILTATRKMHKWLRKEFQQQ